MVPSGAGVNNAKKRNGLSIPPKVIGLPTQRGRQPSSPNSIRQERRFPRKGALGGGHGTRRWLSREGTSGLPASIPAPPLLQLCSLEDLCST